MIKCLKSFGGLLLLLCLSASAANGAVMTIDFEALPHLGSTTACLSGFGITATTEPGTALLALDETIVYGGGVESSAYGEHQQHRMVI
jgi:hypothetical protein